MKFIKVIVSALLVVFILAACGTDKAVQELDNKDTNKAQAKVDEPVQSVVATAPAQTTAASSTESSTPKAEDLWTYYNDAKWSDDFKGLKTEIQKVVVSDKMPSATEPDKFDHSAVGIKVRMENTTKGFFTAYPDQAVLVTSTGEQIDNPEMWASDHIGGEIEEGVIKEGNIVWFLKRGHAEDIKWIKLKWNAYEADDFTKNKEYSIKLTLKQ